MSSMNSRSEINALLSLIDDPDEEVFQSVTQRFIGFGKEVIPFLEDFSISSPQKELISRAKFIIESIALHTLEDALKQWSSSEENSMMEAVMIISAYLEKDFETSDYIFEIEKFRKSIWLELNSYLTPLEEINIFNKIIFDYYKIKGEELDHDRLDGFSTFRLLNEKKSNAYPLGSLFLIMAEMLGISVRPVDVPKQNLLAYVDDSDFGDDQQYAQPVFFVDPVNGQIYTSKDIENYLKRIDYPTHTISIHPYGNRKYIQRWLIEIAACAKRRGDLHTAESLLNIQLSLDDNDNHQ